MPRGARCLLAARRYRLSYIAGNYPNNVSAFLDAVGDDGCWLLDNCRQSIRDSRLRIRCYSAADLRFKLRSLGCLGRTNKRVSKRGFDNRNPRGPRSIGFASDRFVVAPRMLSALHAPHLIWAEVKPSDRPSTDRVVITAALPPPPMINAGVTTDVVAGGMLEYRVEALDPYGNPVLSTPSVSSLLDNPALSPAPSSPLSCSSLDSPGDASALIRCIALDAGNFTLPVTVMGGQPLAGSSPLAVAVSPASPSGTTTRAYGPGTVGGRAGEILEVHLAAADLYGNELTVGGAVVAASFGPAGSLTTGAVTVTDHGNGTYTVAYSVEQLPTPTPGQLSLTIDGQPLQDSPWSPAWTAALPASIPNSTMTVIVNTTDGRLAAGEWTRVGTVTLRDRYGNIATGTEHEALLSGALNPESTIIEDSTNPIHAAGQVALSVHPDGDTFVLYALAQVYAMFLRGPPVISRMMPVAGPRHRACLHALLRSHE